MMEQLRLTSTLAIRPSHFDRASLAADGSVADPAHNLTALALMP